MVVGLVKPDAGDIYLNELNITDFPMYKRARAGLSYLAQEPSIFRRLTVEENILVALEAHGYSSQERREKLESLLQDFRVIHLRESMGFALSGGERRRVEIARALAGSPHFLLLDEPFAGIDPIAVEDIQRIVCELRDRDGIAILITDHSVRETLSITDRAFLIHDGRVILEGASDELVDDPIARKHYLGEDFRM